MTEGALAVELEVRAGRVAEVQVRSSRPVLITRTLEGLDVPTAVRRVQALFALCGEAHGAAAAEACEVALGVEVSEAVRRERALRCHLEAMESHALQLCVGWPRSTDRAPQPQLLLALRKASHAIRHALASSDAGGAAEAVQALRGAVEALVPEAALRGDDQAFGRFVGTAPGPAAAWLRELAEAGAADFGSARAPLLPQLDAGWFARRLLDDHFPSLPTFDGAPAESGALARMSADPAVVDQSRLHGRSLLTRAVAQLADLHARLREVEAGLRSLRRHAPAPLPAGSGQGAAVADTARGQLAHAVTIEHGRVRRWRAVAPTEWTFHPRGVVREALLGAPAKDLRRRATWLVAALDPCVPCTVSVREVSHA